jgi:glycosyltransferase involved in cell wall biosynthesis
VGDSAPIPIKLAKMPGRIFDLRHIVGNLSLNHFDLVHIHWANYGVLGFMSWIPFIIHCHGEDVLHPTFRPILDPIFRRAAAVLAITPDLMPRVQSIRPDALFFPGPIDTDLFSPTEYSQTSRTLPWTILLFARLVPKKGLEIATKGIAQFAQRHPEVRVKLVDWGTEKEKYKQIYGKRFEFVPLVAPRSVKHLIWSADVVVGQFLAGALGLSELQAMSCAKPVIASFRYEDAYPEPPPLCQATSAQAVDEQLEYLYQHPEVAVELGQRAREWIMKYHDNQILAIKLEALYQSIMIRHEVVRVSTN